MKARTLAGGLGCWFSLTAASAPPHLRVALDGLIDADNIAGAASPRLPLRLDALDEAFSTPDQLAASAEKMLLAGKFEEAKPLLSALAEHPDFALHSAFMEGYLALKQKEFAAAAEKLQRAVEMSPDYTRARVELGQALMELGRTREADKQFEIAERDRTLPPEILDVVKTSRRRTAERARWHLNVDAGALADTSLDRPVHTGGRREGFGIGTAASGGVRLRAGDRTAVALEAEGYWNHYGGGTPDEVSLLIAAGPEIRSGTAVVTVQGIAYERWYGDVEASRGLGVRGRYQDKIGDGQRLYLLVDARVFDSGFGDELAGWQASGFLIYEHAIDKTLTLSGTLYGRREWLGSDTFSNTELGAYAGTAILLPSNLRMSLTVGAVRGLYDAPFLRFSEEPRRDWRLSGSLYVGLRKPLVANLWPTFSYHYINTNSSLPIYRTDRHRVRLNLRRPF